MMDISSIIFSAVSIGGLGLVFGLGLGYAAKKFEVKVDPLIPVVRDALPGANCGACGFAGCDAFAKGIVEGQAPINGCPVGGSETAAALSQIMGVEASESARQVAYVKCNGTCENAKEKYIYAGVTDCKNAAFLQGGGSKGCEYGCLGLGSCVAVCEFNAIDIIDGVAVINDNCVACEKCVAACPKAIIEMVPDASKVRVACNSADKGKEVKSNCSVGCIACKICEKACPFDAIHVTDNLARIDYEKCTQCDVCVEKCPTKAIPHLK
jgi:Na+-translocating ferredoxin:NAD+ oxidoreductase RNF subunit RnfB